MTVTILHNQSLFDLSIQYTGEVNNAFLIAKANDLSVSDLLVPGNKITIPGSVFMNNDIYGYFTNKKIKPATGYTSENEPTVLEGIGVWILGKNLKVS